MEENYFGDVSKKTNGFVIALVVLLVCVGLSVNTDLAQYSQHEEMNIPIWFFYVVFGLDLIMLICIILIYFYRKIGIYIFPLAAVIHFMMNNFYLSTTLYSDLLIFFAYFSAALFVAIPRWKYFK
jgi:NADH:ubiquinone oxidoreductase subunit 6 (subunit J)